MWQTNIQYSSPYKGFPPKGENTISKSADADTNIPWSKYRKTHRTNAQKRPKAKSWTAKRTQAMDAAEGATKKPKWMKPRGKCSRNGKGANNKSVSAKQPSKQGKYNKGPWLSTRPSLHNKTGQNKANTDYSIAFSWPPPNQAQLCCYLVAAPSTYHRRGRCCDAAIAAFIVHPVLHLRIAIGALKIKCKFALNS